MTPNAKASEHLALLATLDPVSQGAATVTTGWVSFKNFLAMMAVIQTGVLGASATLDAKLQQAKDGSGTGAKDVTGKAITQIVKATGDNKQAFISMAESDLDTNNDFAFVRLSVTVGVAASLISASLWGMHPSFEDAAAFNQAGVVQNV